MLTAPPTAAEVGEWGYSSQNSDRYGSVLAKLTEEQHAHIVARIFLVSIAAGAEYTMVYEWADNSAEEMGLVKAFDATGKTGATKLAYNATHTLGKALHSHRRFVQRLPVFNLAGQAENPRMEATDDWVLAFADDANNGMLLVALAIVNAVIYCIPSHLICDST